MKRLIFLFERKMSIVSFLLPPRTKNSVDSFHMQICALRIPSSVLNMYIFRTHAKTDRKSDGEKALFYCEHFECCLHAPQEKREEKNQQRSDLLCHVYVKGIIILHAIETIHIAWMKKVLRNLPKMYQNLTVLFRSVLLCWRWR